MTYQETLDWMFDQLPMYQHEGNKAFNSKLDTIQALATHLGNPEKRFKSIHVAGTNGKGSSSHMLASILQEAGYKVGLYTSPHLKDFRERIRINGEVIEEQKVVDFILDHKSFFEANKVSFFEMTVAMAFNHFASEQVDIAVIEVGLGGRLDATNIIIPEVALITNIGMDHTDMLGATLAEITREKAGIIKSGVPVVISERQEGVSQIFETIALSRQAKIIFAEDRIVKKYSTVLQGKYQSKNMKGVLATLDELKAFDISDEHRESGFLNVVKNTGLLGRWQILQEAPVLILDTAHNREGFLQVIEQITSYSFDHLHMILGFAKDKDLNSILPLLPKHATYYFAKPNIPRGLDVQSLRKQAKVHDLKGKAFNSVMEALTAAKATATSTDILYVGGSTFTVAEVL
jgi:dihydrofolate synthase/folylpolyglutamate synthase